MTGVQTCALPISQTLAGQRAVEFVVQTLVLTEEVADLSAADADVARGDVGVRADVFVQLDHEALAEAHDLRVGFALGVKVAAALCAANRKTGQAVFEDLFKAEEFDDALVDRGVKAQAALVGADGVIELDAEATVDMQPALIVRPGNRNLITRSGSTRQSRTPEVRWIGCACTTGSREAKTSRTA